MRLVLVRHGETVGNSSIRYFGRTDVALSEIGRAQMRAARGWLQRRFGSAEFTSVISSPLWRAIEGATIIVAAEWSSPLWRAAEGAQIIAGVDRSIHKIKEFVEVDFGCFEGLTADEIRLRCPADFERWNRDRLDPGFAYPEGESRVEFTRRVERGIQRMLEVIDSAAAHENIAADREGDAAVDVDSAAGREDNASGHEDRAEAHDEGATAHEDGGALPIGGAAGYEDVRAGHEGGVALVVAHRGVIRIIAKRLAGIEPVIELGSIQILQRDRIGDPWRAESIDVVEHLAHLD